MKRIVLYTFFWGLLPLLFLALLEGALRGAGYGHTTEPYIPIQVKNKTYRMVNMRYYEKFMVGWPDSVSAEPYDIVIPEDKAADTYRIAVLGGSAGLGYLRPAHGAWRFLETLLRQQYPQVKFEVYYLGWNGMNSHVMRHITRASRALKIDHYVLYMGNNEVKGTLSFMYNTDHWWLRHPRTASIMTDCYAAYANLRIGQYIAKSAGDFFGRPNNLREWELSSGYETPFDPGLKHILNNYQYNIEAIIREARKQEAAITLSTVGHNLRHFKPITPEHRLGLSAEESEVWKIAFEKGQAAEEREDYEEALNAYQEAAAIDREHAGLLFRWATCLWKLKRYAEANSAFICAADNDLSLITANTRTNAIVRRMASRNQNNAVSLADAEAALSRNSLHKTPGYDLFTDHVHLRSKSAYIVAKTMLQAMAPTLPPWIRVQHSQDRLPSFSGTCKRMGFTDFDSADEIDAMISALPSGDPQEPILKKQLQTLNEKLAKRNHDEESLRAQEKALESNKADLLIWDHFVARIGNREDAEYYTQAFQGLFPGHWRPYYRLAEFYRSQNDFEKTQAVLAILTGNFGHCAESWFQQGIMLEHFGKETEAIRAYRQAASMKRVNDFPCLAIAALLTRQEKYDQAALWHIKAIKARPERDDYYQQLIDFFDIAAFSLPQQRNCFEELLKEALDSNTAMLLLAAACYAEGNESKAKDLLHRAKAIQENSLSKAQQSLAYPPLQALTKLRLKVEIPHTAPEVSTTTPDATTSKPS